MGDAQLPQPGFEILSRVALEVVDSKSHDEAFWQNQVNALAEGLALGVSLRDSLTVTRAFFKHLLSFTSASGLTNLSASWAGGMVERLYRSVHVCRIVDLLSDDHGVKAYQLLDILNALSLPEDLPAEEFKSAVIFVREFPVPAVATAAWIIPILGIEPSADRVEEIGNLLDSVNDYATSADVLHRAWQFSFDHRMAAHLEERGDGALQQPLLCRLDEIEEELNQQLGSGPSVRKAGLLERSKRGEMAKDRDQLMAPFQEGNIPPVVPGNYARGHIAHLKGRIYAHTNELRKAKKQFHLALELGFAPLKVVPHLADLFVQQGQNDDARTVVEQCAESLLHPHGAKLPGKMAELGAVYAGAGGDPAALGTGEHSAGFETTAIANRVKWSEIVVRKAVERESRLTKLWKQAKADAITLICESLEAKDLDASLGSDSASERWVKLDLVLARLSHLDEVPGLEPMKKDILVAAAVDGIPATDLATEFINYLRNKEKSGSSFESLLAKHNVYARSFEIARQKVGLEAKSNPNESLRLVLLYREKKYLPPKQIAELSEPVLAELFYREGTARLLSVSKQLIGKLRPGRAQDMVKETARSLLFERLRVATLHSERKLLVRNIADITGELDGTAKMYRDWLTSLHLRLVSAGRQTEAEELSQLVQKVCPELGQQPLHSTRDSLLNELNCKPVGESPLTLLERLAALFKGDELVESSIARWFEVGFERLQDPRDKFEAAATGEWLAAQLTTMAGEPVRQISLEYLRNLLDQSRSESETFLLLARLSRLEGESTDFNSRLVAISRRKSAVLIAAFVTCGVATCGGMWLLVNFLV